MSNILSVHGVVKRYGNYAAVDHITFDIPKGSIFGMLGPNGAGKTSLIRIITTITGPDEGQVLLDGQPLTTSSPTLMGYMPEERGLYKKMKVGDHLLYLAQLKGMDLRTAHKAIKSWMDKFEIQDWWNKKIEELSKGMQQKIQFISTVVHNPKLLILDEPFSGLDPINANLIKDEIYALNKQGTSIIFSTHRMEQVEEICEQIVLVNKGKVILQGGVSDIKEQYKEHKYRLTFDGYLPEALRNDAAFTVVKDTDQELIIQVREGHHPNELLMSLIQHGVEIKSYQEILPSLNQIFIKKVGEASAAE